MLLNNGYLRNLLFIDIETVPGYGSYASMPDAERELWDLKHATLRQETETSEQGYLRRAGIYSEFARVICISIGYFHYDRQTNTDKFRLKSISGSDEHALLAEFAQLLHSHFTGGDRWFFAGHNIREFDVPFLCRRMVIQGIKLPAMLDISGKKPWETEMMDTMQLWKFGDNKSYTSLKLLAYVLSIPSPKGDIDGSDVCRVYYEEEGLSRIVEYCQRDVVTVARLIMRLQQETDTLDDTDVIVTGIQNE